MYVYSTNYTMAMCMANIGVIPPKEFYHNPSLTTSQKNTVAMLLA